MIDYKFVELMFKKYSKHLQDVVTSIETNIDGYDRQLTECRKLDQKKYSWRVKLLEEKKTEAFKKLAHICPNMDKMAEQLQNMQEILTQEDIDNDRKVLDGEQG